MNQVNPTKFYRIFSSILLLSGLFSFILYFILEPAVLGPIMVAAMVCIFVDPISNLLRSFGFFQKSAPFFAILLFSVIISIVFYFAWPVLYQDTMSFINSVDLQAMTQNLNVWISKINSFMGFEIDLSHMKEKIMPLIQSIDYFKLISNVALWILFSPVFVFFFMVDTHKIRNSLFKLIPNAYFEIFSIIVYKIWFQLGAYLRARIMEVVIMTIASYVLFLTFGLPLPLFLGICAGVMTIVPYAGPIIGAIPGILLAFSDSRIGFGTVFGLYGIVNAVDMFLVFPLLMSKVVAIHPLMIIFSVLIGAKFFGIWGVILAIPISGAVYVTYQELKNYQYRDA